jgi:hypothetical protein
MKSLGGISLRTVTSIMVDEAMLTLLPNVIQSIPNLPPIVPAAIDIGVGLGQLEVAGKIAKGLPSPAGPIVKAMLEIQGVLVTVAAIPKLMTAIGSMATSTTAGGQ